jgi:biotin operon repressor
MSTRRRDQLAAFFFDHREAWLSRYQLGQVIGHGSVTQRLSELRRDGLQIELRRQWMPKLKAYRTFYRYQAPKVKGKAA